MRRFKGKDAKMASKSAILLVAAALSGCAYKAGPPSPATGLEAVNQPVLSRSDYVFDAAAPGGNLPPSEAARLDSWFGSLDLRYGDSVYVDAGPYSEAARAEVAGIAGKYGLLVSPGAPVTAGAVPAGNVRVVVSRTVASVPNCPNWEGRSAPNYNNKSMPGFGCAVNGNLAAMVANPEDLFHGREGSTIIDTATASKAVDTYRSAKPTGAGGLQDISTKGN
jgi:pilus assembly protein CpaD